MEFKKGTNRIVFIFPRLGFVIKLPRFYVWLTLKTIFRHPPRKKYREYLKKWFNHEVEVYWSFKYYLYKGIYDNWHEYKFYSTTQNIFLQPTYFSLFGLVNIQCFGKSEVVPFNTLLPYFMNITDNEAFKDSHHFANYRNFCFKNSKIRITDYGSKRTQAIVEKWGEKIVREFNLEDVVEKEEKTA